jgi:CRP-like cAMP-binding protein
MSPSSVNKTLAWLQSAELFKGLDPTSLNTVLQSSARAALEENSFLFHEGDPAIRLYVLIEGRLKLAQGTPDGQQVIMHMITPGEAIGVVAALSSSLHPVSAQAVKDSMLIGWDHETIQRLMERCPIIALNALQILSDRIRDFQDRIRELATERVERRIARVLLRLARQAGQKVDGGVLIDLPLSRQDIAEMTGATLYTISRTLSQWESKGLIQSSRERIVIRYPHGLVKIAEDL